MDIAKQSHPDVVGHDSEVFKKANIAYQVLKDPKSRSKYDALR